jgi:hypothetical protein
MATKMVRHHWQLDGYKLSVETDMKIFSATKKFPREEMYSLTDPTPWLLAKATPRPQ